MKKYLVFCLFLTIISCKKPYRPEIVETDVNFLVAEGRINGGGEPTLIKLSRTTNLTEERSKPELNASVYVQSNAGENFFLAELGKGEYISAPLPIEASKQYKLRIQTRNGLNYESDFVKPKNSPEIDEIGWEIKPDGLLINTSTHDISNDSRYYRFEYEETWKFNTRYNSLLIIKDGKIVTRDPVNEEINNCFGNNKSSEILLATTAQLSSDVLSKSSLVLISPGDEKISVKYSIGVKQYVMSEPEYKYWSTLKKNTENIGSIFDPQPSFSLGNIRCINKPEEKVLGYIGAGSSSQKRIFIERSELPEQWKKDDPYQCGLNPIPVSDIGTIINDPVNNAPVFTLTDPKGNVLTYMTARIGCVDCTLRGTKLKPAFWPN